jgi:uncharacterized delta-60 repeat protein
VGVKTWQTHFRASGRAAALAVFALLLTAPTASQARPGDPDPTFSHDGQLALQFHPGSFNAGADGANAVALQPDGRIVVVGSAKSDSGTFAFDSVVVRFLRNGALDPSFGDGGVLRLDLGRNDRLAAVALDGAGRIVLAGTSWGRSSALRRSRMLIARLMPDGQLDGSFADHGLRATELGGGAAAEDLELKPHGGILVAGSERTAERKARFALLKLDSTGHLDPSFGGDGVHLIGFGPRRDAHGVALNLDARGRITVGGTSVRHGRGDAAFARVTSSGKPDRSFAADGRRVVDVDRDDMLTGMAVTPRGAVIAEGMSRRIEDFSIVSSDLFLTRLRRNGALKRSFGRRGKRIINLNRYDTAGAVTLQDDGKIVLTANTNAGTHTFVVARYKRGGQIDRSFAGNGKMVTKIGSGWASYPRDVVLQPNGKIVVVGVAVLEYDDWTRLVVARYKNDGLPAERLDE